MIWAVLILVAILGGAIGSFLNVVIYRVPIGASIVSPPSACPGCGSEIKPYDNIPVLSWMLLRGRCRSCAEPISIRYPLVEAGTAILFVLAALRFVPPLFDVDTVPAVVGGILALVAYLYLASISVALALIDIDTHRLPNAIVLPAYAVGVVAFVAAAWLSGDWTSLVTAGIGLLSLGGFYLVLFLISPAWMGGGDVKLAGVLGLFLGFLGWGPLVIGAFSAFLLGGLFGVAVLIAKRGQRGQGIPFGPWMLLGAWIGILVGEPIAAWYLSLFGLGV
ncbi:prepilin peptidase [Leifsonia sp. Leaf264]|uniref:prepilin peptidase n=1 Tax=Leifsonia sp. Leaf264 TaxID=1736314 RepID=UPI0006F7742B|nr:A24 family peptidase [Leifsonia sp. Leaf264]KQO97396.1 peptidase A24 [Leifsonia sp. Leaf264]